ncbi:MAG: hypothetical protein RIR39_1554 [Pseudomonadota bacterium]
MANNFNLRAIISATDNLTPVLRAQQRQLNAWRRSFASAGKMAMPMAAGLGAAILIPAKAFAEAESAATQLQNTLMTSNGLSAGFKELSAIATDLGNQLPGTTADFMSMASQLKALGVSTETLTGGALKATAYLAVVGKPLGVTYESAAEAVGKLGSAFGIAANDLMPFTDSLQRTLHMGVDLGEMQYAMARVGGILKGVGKQGLGVANDLVPLVAMLIKSGVSGEEAGTGISKMIQVASLKGKFTDIPTLVKDLEKMNGLAPSAKLSKFKELFGEEHMKKALTIAGGGYTQMVAEMKKQADMQQRINNSLGTLTNLWDAATGTFTNAMAAFAESYAPELKQLAQSVGELSSKFMIWAKENGPFIKMALESAAAFVGLKLAFYGASIALGILTGLMRANPWMLLVQGLAIAGPFIYEHWGAITSFIKDTFNSAIDWILQKWESLKNIFSGLKDLLPTGGDMNMAHTASPESRKKMINSPAAQVRGGIDVNFNNTPAGTRVTPTKTQGPFAVTPNVGYRSFATGAAW